MAIHQIIVIFHRLVEFFFVFFYGNVSSFYAFIHSFIHSFRRSVRGLKAARVTCRFCFLFCFSLFVVGFGGIFRCLFFVFARARVCVSFGGRFFFCASSFVRFGRFFFKLSSRFGRPSLGFIHYPRLSFGRFAPRSQPMKIEFGRNRITCHCFFLVS